MERISAEASYAVRKAQGGMPLDERDKKAIQQAILQTPPSSPEFKMLSEALGSGGQPQGGMPGGGEPWVPGLPAGVPNPISAPQPASYSQVHGQQLPDFQARAMADRLDTAIPDTSSFPVSGSPIGGGARTGEAPVAGGGVPPQRGTLGTDWGPSGAITAANPSLLLNAGTPAGDWDTGQVPIDPIMGGMNAYGLDKYVNDPSFAADLFASQQTGGKGNYMSQYYEAPMNTALALAKAGVLGTGHGDTLMGDSAGSNEVARRADEFMTGLYGGDQAMFPNVDEMIDEIYNRALNTDFTQQTDESGRDVTVDDMIDTTNNALYQISSFMPKDSADWLASTLNGAARQYKLDFAQGKTTVSYPEYLREMGITDALGING